MTKGTQGWKGKWYDIHGNNIFQLWKEKQRPAKGWKLSKKCIVSDQTTCSLAVKWNINTTALSTPLPYILHRFISTHIFYRTLWKRANLVENKFQISTCCFCFFFESRLLMFVGGKLVTILETTLSGSNSAKKENSISQIDPWKTKPGITMI